MLVLTRKRNETIKIGNNIVVKVIRTKDGSVKIGIDAPENVRVMRGEIATEANLDDEHDYSEMNESLLGVSLYEALLVQS